MKIDCAGTYRFLNLKPNNNLSFKGYPDWFEEDSFYDDPYSREARNKIRDGIYERIFGISSVADTENTSTEMRYANSIEDVRVMNFRNLGHSSYSGECLVRKPEYMKLLGRSGVTKVIDLIDSQKLKELCKENGLDYYLYDMNWGYGGQALFCDEKNLIKERSKELAKNGLTKKEFDEAINSYKSKLAAEKTTAVRKLAKLIDKVNQGHFYMSCEYGEYRTVNCLAMVSTFNPKWWGEKIEPATTEFAQKMKNFYKNLTAEHKQILGLNEDYCKYLKKYVAQLVHKI